MVNTMQSSNFAVLRFHIILRDTAGQVLRDLYTKKRGKIVSLVRDYEWASAHLNVRYGETGMVNEGEYTDRETLSAALSAFVEQELREYVAGGVTW